MTDVARVQGTTATPGMAPASAPAPKAAPPQVATPTQTSSCDGTCVTNRRGSAPATMPMLSTQTASAPAPSAPPVSLNAALPGFRAGQRVSVGATGFFGAGMVGGGGQVTALSADRINMRLKIDAPFGAGGDLAIDLRYENGAYVLRSPENWNARVSRNGNSVTVQNASNPNQRITVTAVRDGQVHVATRGMGFDGKTLVITAR